MLDNESDSGVDHIFDPRDMPLWTDIVAMIRGESISQNLDIEGGNFCLKGLVIVQFGSFGQNIVGVTSAVEYYGRSKRNMVSYVDAVLIYFAYCNQR